MMAIVEKKPLVREMRKWAHGQLSRELTDGQLLERFRLHADHDAFAALLRRHRECVWGVCRRMLASDADAEDAFQATFLFLVLKADAVHKADSLSSWLHGVAYRCGMQIKRQEARRRSHEREATSMKQTNPCNETAFRELQGVLDEEIQRLPQTQRSAFLLCCLEGLSKAEAARQLGWKEGTVSSRLARARKQLQQRLARRGFTLSAVLAAVAVSSGAGSRTLAALTETTLRAAMTVGDAKTVAGAGLSSQVAVIIHQVCRTMATMKFTTLKILLPLLMLVGVGTGTWALQPAPGDVPASLTQPQVALLQEKNLRPQVSDITKKRVGQVEQNLDSIVLEISPVRALRELDTLRLLGPKAKGPDRRPGVEHRVTREELAKVVDVLAADGFFDRAFDDPPKLPPKTTCLVQFYGPVFFAEPLHGEPLLDRLLAMRKVMTGETALAMDRLYVHAQWLNREAHRPIREGEDILHYADRFGLKQLVQDPDGIVRRARYGDDALAKAEEKLNRIPHPWTLDRIMAGYQEEVKKPPVQQTDKSYLQRLLAASRDPRAAVLLGKQVEGNQPDLGAVNGLMDYFLPDVLVTGGTEQHIDAVQKWWKENEKRLRAEAEKLSHPD